MAQNRILKLLVVYKKGRFLSVSTQCLWEHKRTQSGNPMRLRSGNHTGTVYPQDSSEGKGEIYAPRRKRPPLWASKTSNDLTA